MTKNNIHCVIDNTVFWGVPAREHAEDYELQRNKLELF
jgi:hypothetical protein